MIENTIQPVNAQPGASRISSKISVTRISIKALSALMPLLQPSRFIGRLHRYWSFDAGIARV